LQIYEHAQWEKLSTDNQLSTTWLKAQRGFITDRKGKPLAINQPEINLEITYHGPKQFQESLNKLAKLLQIDPIDFSVKKSTPKKNFVVLRDLSQNQLETIILNPHVIKHARLTTGYKRIYPCGQACAFVTGYLKRNQISTNDSQDKQGQGGIEAFYDAILRGKPGTQTFIKNARGQMVEKIGNTPPEHGYELRLSIDVEVQQILHRHLKGHKASAVIADPRSGEILGLHSEPAFDPNDLTQPTDSKRLQALFNHPYSPLLNRVINGLYPPASTVKPFLALTALQESIITPSTSIFDPGYYRYKDTSYTYHNWYRQGHGKVNLEKALILSNDTYFYELGMKMGIDKISQTYKQFGFSKPSGIDLPEEKIGNVPSREAKKLKGEKWMIGETLITVIGQGQTLVTPIQMLRAINMIANRGQDKPIFLLNRSQLPFERQLNLPSPPMNMSADLSISPKFWSWVINTMTQVTERGTGIRFGDFPHPIAAKTGTAQMVRVSNKQTSHDKKDHSWFIGFTPDQKPQISFIFLVENENIAPLIAKNILSELQSLGYLT
jgi:penicillin-binding protein 2